MTRLSVALLAVGVCSGCDCGRPLIVDGGVPDAGADAGAAPDAGVDAGTDGGPVDAGPQRAWLPALPVTDALDGGIAQLVAGLWDDGRGVVAWSRYGPDGVSFASLQLTSDAGWAGPTTLLTADAGPRTLLRAAWPPGEAVLCLPFYGSAGYESVLVRHAFGAAPTTRSLGAGSDCQLARDGTGDIIVTWQDRFTVWSAWLGADGGALELTDGGLSTVGHQLAPAGRGAVVALTESIAGQFPVATRWLTAPGAAGPLEAVPGVASSPRVLVPDGVHPLAAWATGAPGVFVRDWQEDGGWSGPDVKLDSTSSGSRAVASLVGDGRGGARITWREIGTYYYAARAAPGAPWSSPVPLTAPRIIAYPNLALAADGSGQLLGLAAVGALGQMVAMPLSATGVAGAAVPLDNPRVVGDAWALAVAPSGDALAVWVVREVSGERLYAARYTFP